MKIPGQWGGLLLGEHLTTETRHRNPSETRDQDNLDLNPFEPTLLGAQPILSLRVLFTGYLFFKSGLWCCHNKTEIRSKGAEASPGLAHSK